MAEDRAASMIRMLNAGMDAAEALDPRGMIEHYSDDAVFEFPFAPPGFPSRIQGRPAIAEFFAQFPKYYRKIRFVDRQMTALADGTGIVAEYRGEWVNVKGRSYNNTYILLARFRDNQVVHIREYFDPRVWLESLGREG